MQKANIDIIKYLVNDAKVQGRPKPIIFLGAGASASAGIPLTGKIVEDVFQKFHENPRIEDLKNRSQRNYYEVMGTLTSAERHRLFREYIEADNVKINVTHIYLAHLLKEEYIDYIVTVNFDNLMLRACALFNFIPPVYDIAILKDLTTTTIHERSVIHLHGQHHGLWQLNTEKEQNKINHGGQNSVGNIFRQICNDRTWIVIGYGGEDGVLDEIAKLGRFDNQLFWVGYKNNLPSDNVRKKLLDQENSDAFWVSGYSADSFVLELHSQLRLETPLIFQRPFSFVHEVMRSVKDIDSEVEIKQHSNPKHRNLFSQVEKRIDATNRWIFDAILRYEEQVPSIELLSDSEIKITALILYIHNAISHQEYEEAEQLAARFPSIQVEEHKKNNLLNSINDIGWLFESAEQYDTAIKWYKKALAKDSTFVWALIGIGDSYLGKNKYDTAIKWYEKVLAEDPTFVWALIGIGNSYLGKNKYDTAIEWYKKVLEIDSTSWWALMGIGDSYRGKKEYDVSIDWYNKVLENEPTSVRVLIGIGNAFFEKKDYDTALRWYQDALKINPEEYWAFTYIGSVYSKKKEYDTAIRWCQEAININPTNDVALAILGGIYLKMGNLEAAQKILDQIIPVDSHVSAYNLGRMYLCKKNEQQAISFYKKALIVFDDKKGLVQAMEEDYEYLVQYGITKEYYQSIINKVLHPEQDF